MESDISLEQKKHLMVGVYCRYIKRLMDLMLSLVALVLLSPVIAMVAISVKFAMGGSVLFNQKRPGLKGEIFTLYKFRTMTNKCYPDGTPLPDEMRLTKFGTFLRSTSMDELPSLVNILKGDISIVGPRPQLVRDLVFMTNKQKERHLVRPGLTGLAQVNGRNAITWEERFKYDLEYIEKISLTYDLKIILKTFVKVFSRSDINTDGMATSEDLGDYLLRTNQVSEVEYKNKMKMASDLLINR